MSATLQVSNASGQHRTHAHLTKTYSACTACTCIYPTHLESSESGNSAAPARSQTLRYPVPGPASTASGQCSPVARQQLKAGLDKRSVCLSTARNRAHDIGIVTCRAPMPQHGDSDLSSAQRRQIHSHKMEVVTPKRGSPPPPQKTTKPKLEKNAYRWPETLITSSTRPVIQ